LLVNSIGDDECRPQYVAGLKNYYTDHYVELCQDCRNRLERNPLRLLDCKVQTCRALGEAAPRSVDQLCADCQQHWDKFLSYLSTMNIPFSIDHRLVRGLDYYTRTVFEIQPSDVGGQSTICGGGRYDKLIEQLDGKHTPGIGFGSGIERLTLNLKRSEIAVPDEPKPTFMVINVGEAARPAALELAANIRRAGVGAILGNGSRALRGQMRQANALGISYAVVLGDDEIQRGEVVIRDMSDSSQEAKPLEEFLNGLTSS